MSGIPTPKVKHIEVPPNLWQRLILRRTVRCSCGWSGHVFEVHRSAAEELARLRDA